MCNLGRCFLARCSLRTPIELQILICCYQQIMVAHFMFFRLATSNPIFGDPHAVMACVSINAIRSEAAESVQPLLDRNIAITPSFVFRTFLLFA